MIEEIYKDINNNDYSSLSLFLDQEFYSGLIPEKAIYAGATSVSFDSRHISNNRYYMLTRAVELLRSSSAYKFGTKNIYYVPLFMYELLPEKIGIELYCYKL